MSVKRKTYSAEFKAKLVLEVLKEKQSLNQIASKYEMTPKNLQNWKKQFLENMSLAFDKSAVVKEYKDEIHTLQKDKDTLAKKVGNLTIEKDFLEGKLVSLASSKDRQALIDTKLDLSLNKQSWSTDITYIKLEKGFVYLAAIIDWHSKKVLSWKLSNTMDVSLTTSVLKEALGLYVKPEIVNTDQGSQYTAKAHIDILKKHDIKISMDGKGRATDNICIERFWRTIKYEEIYLNEYKNIKVLRKAIENYIQSYNAKRLHSAIAYQTPNEVYYQATNNLKSKGVKLLPMVS